MRLILYIVCAPLLLACFGASSKAKGPAPRNANEIMQQLEVRADKVESFMAESRMEYWARGQRIKPTVLVMGKQGAKVRFNALSPTGGNVAADLACNGADFQFVDFERNCQRTGPCNKDSIAQLLGVSLAPDDFLTLAAGSTPMIDSAIATTRWDAAKRQHILNLRSRDGQQKQKIVLDGRNQDLDVLSSTVWNAEGKVEWRLTNKNFSKRATAGQQAFRVPDRTRFEQPGAKAEVTIRWIEREFNAAIAEHKFGMTVPPLPSC